jgi:hypothetical protein
MNTGFTYCEFPDPAEQSQFPQLVSEIEAGKLRRDALNIVFCPTFSREIAST